MDYDYHFFYGLEKKMVAKTFQDWKPEFVDKAYANWNRHFNRTANLFYQSQLEAHTELVEKMFCRQYKLTSMDALEEYEYQNLWRSFSNEHGLTAHKSQWDDKIYLSDLYHGSVGYYSGADAADNFLERMTSKELHPHDTIVEMLITRLWFNTEFNNSPEIASELRQLPY